MIIKVCGLSGNYTAREVNTLPKVAYLGFIFFEGSKRYTETSLATAKKKVGVFVNAPPEYVIAHIEKHGLDAVQLHGSESPDYIRQLPEDVGIIKAFGIASEADLEKTGAYEGLADYFLFDTKSDQHGGTGAAFDWEILKNYTGNTPFLLSGGIGNDSVGALKAFSHPKLAGYDLNSRFETAPKIKDAALIDRFINEMKL
ncbi:phosphoribosylanthranilate isomerase [Flavobacterium sp. RHBU_24]|uniref:phosphoribosylanthranilate isomerase n=1 Tax=Flavobacterium sp. RHBU_24 TaxID=3391185 RepID=UPI0039852E2D